MYPKSLIAVILILAVLGFGLSSPSLEAADVYTVPTADIEKLAPPTLSQVAASCSALTTVIYNPSTTVTSFVRSEFWDQFTTPEAIEKVQNDVAMSLRIDPTLIEVFLKASKLCVKVKVETFERTFGFDPTPKEPPDE